MDADRSSDVLKEIHGRDAIQRFDWDVQFVQAARVARPLLDGFIVFLFITAHRAIKDSRLHIICDS